MVTATFNRCCSDLLFAVKFCCGLNACSNAFAGCILWIINLGAGLSNEGHLADSQNRYTTLPTTHIFKK